MHKGRLEAFSDGVIAIIITIMVLEMRVPHGDDWAALLGLLPVFLSYVLSFIYVGLYWNNHHHMLQATQQISGGVLWANLHFLFWLSLFPFATGWMGENHYAAVPTAFYGAVLLCASIAYLMLEKCIISVNGADSVLARSIGKDHAGKISAVGYAAAIPLAFVNQWISDFLYVLIAAIWIIPDQRIEKVFKNEQA